MKRLALVLALLALSAVEALATPAPFGKSKVTPQGYLLLPATEVFLSTGSSVQTTMVRQAMTEWQDTFPKDGRTPPLLALVSYKDGGTFWQLKGKELTRLDGWSADKLGYDPETVRAGRLFGFLGAQFMRGDVDSTGFNARLGSTLLQNRYDFALTFGHTSIADTDINTFGLMGRALFPISDKLGWNAGAQLVRSSANGGSQTTAGVLAGLNLYMPGGSLDITFQAGDRGVYGLLAGYTFFLSRD